MRLVYDALVGCDVMAFVCRNLATVFVWMDILCINQHPAKMRKDLPRLKEVICRCKQTLLFLDPAADVLMRMWCLYEVGENRHGCLAF